MPPRVIATFLAFVLLWTAFGTMESPRVIAAPTGHSVVFEVPMPAPAQQGSVEHHHLDDLPLQAQGDPAADMPGLPSGPLKRAGRLSASAHRQGVGPADAGSPFIAGLLRPPARAAFIG